MILADICENKELARVLAYIRTLPNWNLFEITRFVYNGTIAGSPMAVYNNLVMYLAERCTFDIGTMHLQTSIFRVELFDYNNDRARYMTNQELIWQAGAPDPMYFSGNIMTLKNYPFSRIVTGFYTYTFFNGYRLEIS